MKLSVICATYKYITLRCIALHYITIQRESLLKQMFSLFKVDLPTFMTLTEEDLKELGINAFGARKKMLLTIQGKLCLIFFWSSSSQVKRKASTICIQQDRSFAACCASPHESPSLLARLSQYVPKLFWPALLSSSRWCPSLGGLGDAILVHSKDMPKPWDPALFNQLYRINLVL